MAAYKFGAVGMAGGIIALAAIAAWLGLAHVFDPKTESFHVESVPKIV